jgi:hypothetical protein
MVRAFIKIVTTTFAIAVTVVEVAATLLAANSYSYS